jgi:uncharacterized protein (DUF4415 family)
MDQKVKPSTTPYPAATSRKRRSQGRALTAVNRWEDVPQFASEAEEQAFWSTHTLGEPLLEQFKPVPVAGDTDLPPARQRPDQDEPRTRPIAIRLDRDVLRRLRAVAAKKGKGYQTLLKEFVMERLYEEEKREGLLAP